MKALVRFGLLVGLVTLWSCGGSGSEEQAIDSLDAQAGAVELEQGAPFQFTGSVEIEGSQRVILEFFDQGGWSPMQTAQVAQDGSFSFSGYSEAQVPGVYQLQVLPSRTTIMFVLGPEPLTVTIDAKGQPSFEGSRDSDLLQEMIALTGKKQMLLDSLQQRYKAAPSEAEAQRIMEKIRAQAKKDVAEYQRFLIEKAPSFISIMGSWEFLGEDAFGHMDFLEKVAQLHSDPRAHPYAAEFVAQVNKLSQPAPQISLKTAEGRTVNLSDFKGKVVLVDFWASWCGPCRAENPSNVQLYKKYKSKGFEMLGVSLDTSREKWLKAVQSDGLLWPQVIDADDQAANAYGVTAIPHTVLVDRKGRIVAIGLRGPQLEAKLKEML